MRHLLSLILALVLSPLIYVAAGFSAVKVAEANGGDSLAIVPAVVGLGSALVAGALYALLVMARLSPLGPVLAGLAYLGVSAWALFDQGNFLSTVPGDLAGVRNVLHVPAGFGSALLAVPLLATIFSPRRWRRKADGPSAQTAAYPSPASAAPTYAPLGGSDAYAAPSYAPTTFEQPQPTLTTPTYEAPKFETPSYGAPPPAPSFQPPMYTPPPGSSSSTFSGFTPPQQTTPPEGEDPYFRR
jgi:hypothetical protein